MEFSDGDNVLDFCPYGKAVRNLNHYIVRSKLADALKEMEFIVYQGNVRRINFIAITRKNNSIPRSDSKHMPNNR